MSRGPSRRKSPPSLPPLPAGGEHRHQPLRGFKRHLAQANAHVETGRKNIARQREVIAKLERDGHDTKQARATLDTFEELQAMHLSDRKRILREIGEEEEAGP